MEKTNSETKPQEGFRSTPEYLEKVRDSRRGQTIVTGDVVQSEEVQDMEASRWKNVTN